MNIDVKTEYPDSKYPLYEYVKAHEEIEQVACFVYYQAFERIGSEDPTLVYDILYSDDDYSYFGDREGFLNHIHGEPEDDGDYYRSWINDAQRVCLSDNALIVYFDNTIEADVFDNEDCPGDIISRDLYAIEWYSERNGKYSLHRVYI